MANQNFGPPSGSTPPLAGNEVIPLIDGGRASALISEIKSYIGSTTIPNSVLVGGNGSTLQGVTVGANLNFAGGALNAAYSPTSYGTITDGGTFGDGLSHPASSNGFSTLAALQAIFNAASFTATGSGTNLTVTSVVGVLYAGLTLGITTGISAGITIVSQTSGTMGGAGVYVTSSATTISAAAATASWASATSNDMAGLMIQAAIIAAHAAGSGKVVLPPGEFYNIPSGITLPANTKAKLAGSGVNSVLLCSPCGTNPGVTVLQQATNEGPVSWITLWGMNTFTYGSQTGGGTAQTNIYTSGSVGMFFKQNAVVTYTGLQFVNFDLATDWDVTTGGSYIFTFRDCVYQYNNKAAVINQTATNSFEKMTWDNCLIAGNNYGGYLIFQSSSSQGSGSSVAADAYFRGCSFDYNNINMIYYLGAGYNDDFINSVYCDQCHFETNTTCSGTAPRIAHDGNLSLSQCESFESGGNPQGLVTGLSFFSSTTLINNKGPTLNSSDASAVPLYYGGNTLNVSGYGNTNRGAQRSLLLTSPSGSISGWSPADPSRLNIAASTTLDFQHQMPIRAILVSATCNLTVAPDSTTNMIVGTMISFITTPGSTATFVAGSGVTIATSGSGLTFGGTTAKNVTLTKTAANTWSASGQMT